MIEQFIMQLETHRTSLILNLQMTDQLLARLKGEEQGDPTACQHPEDKRINLSTFGGAKSWICKLCDHEHREGEA